MNRPRSAPTICYLRAARGAARHADGDAAIAADRSDRRIRGNLGPGFEQHSHFPGADQRAADISVLSDVVSKVIIRLQCWQLVWKTVADFLRALTEKLRALRTFDFDFFVNHGMAPKTVSCGPELKGLLIYPAKYLGRLFRERKFSIKIKATSKASALPIASLRCRKQVVYFLCAAGRHLNCRCCCFPGVKLFSPSWRDEIPARLRGWLDRLLSGGPGRLYNGHYRPTAGEFAAGCRRRGLRVPLKPPSPFGSD